VNEAKVRVVVPTLNAAGDWPAFSAALLRNISPEHVLIIDSSSTDGTAEAARASGVHVETIPRSEFNHGATRQRGADYFADADIVVFLTQDAELVSNDELAKLCKAFDDAEVGAAYGRQLPRRDAGVIEAHARLFNYPPASQVKSAENGRAAGFKDLFFSNSFGAYRRVALQQAGGFPKDVIFGEDTVTIAALMTRGWKVAYVAEAAAYHSHAHSISQEFRRYFDIGVLHSQRADAFAAFGGVGGEGKKFVKSEIAYVAKHAPQLLPSASVRTALKLAGYRLGRVEHLLPRGLKRKLSLSPSFWKPRPAQEDI
jgi:rhamnosyltransferase